MASQLVHATCIAFENGGTGQREFGKRQLIGVLLRGPSGAGKSDLALRLVDSAAGFGAHLVADDQTELRREKDGLLGRSPDNLVGKIEVRGLGIVTLPVIAEAPIGLVVDLVASENLERYPAHDDENLLGVAVPRISLDPFESSAPAKLRLAVRELAAPNTDTNNEGAFRVSSNAKNAVQKDAEHIVLVTGLSGAGRSSALKLLEDIGYEAIDNLPLHLLRPVAAAATTTQPLAIGIDIRTRDFAAEPLLAELDHLMVETDHEKTLLFLDCDDEILVRRYTETRRRHPLAQERPVADGIAAERRLMAPLRARADLVIDTSQLKLSELSRLLSGNFSLIDSARLAIFVTSFSFRHGLPRSADLVFDVRFLANPYYDLALRKLTGRDPKVAGYIESDAGFPAFYDQLTTMLAPLLPRYEQEGKSYLTIAVGCTGGRHRSVAVAEKLFAWLDGLGHQVNLAHRDLD